MINKAIITILTIAVSAHALSSENNFAQVNIKNAHYETPSLKGASSAGTLNFRDMNINWNGMSVGIRNNNEIFNSRIIKRKNYMGLVGDNLNLGMQFDDDAFFENIKTLDITDSNFMINPLFFSFTGNSFVFKGSDFNMTLKDFNLYCNGGEDVNMTTPAGIFSGCLNASTINSSSKSTGANAEVSAETVFKSDNISGFSNITALNIKNDRVSLKSLGNQLSVPGYFIHTGPMTLTCHKDKLSLDKLDMTSVYNDCTNDFTVESKKIVISDKTEGTKFFVDAKVLETGEGKLEVYLPSAQIVDEKDSTTMLDVDIKCGKSGESDILDLQMVIADCIKGGEVKVGAVVSAENGKVLFDAYDTIIGSNKHPTIHVKKSQASAKDISLTLNNNTVKIHAVVKAGLLGDVNVYVNGKIKHSIKDKKIVLTVTSTKMPLGFRSINFLMKLIKKYLVNSFISVNGQDIIITL